MNTLHARESERSAAEVELTLTATSTLTRKQIAEYKAIVLNAATATTTTLPAASTDMAGVYRMIGNVGAGVASVYVAAGFGGVGATATTIDLAQGEMTLVYCSGTYWFALHHTAAS